MYLVFTDCQHIFDRLVKDNVEFPCDELNLKNESYHAVRYIRWRFEDNNNKDQGVIAQLNVEVKNDSSLDTTPSIINATHHSLNVETGSLKISQLVVGDAGLYTCQVSTEDTTIDKLIDERYRLHVYGKILRIVECVIGLYVILW